MHPKRRATIRGLLLLVVASSLVAWLGKVVLDARRAAWLASRPGVVRFALIGRIDVDRDGDDDRAEVRRLIEAAGGLVDYDLPPGGRESGQIGPMTTWYVVDDRAAAGPSRDGGADQKRREAAIARARSEGVRPLRVERLLGVLGKDKTSRAAAPAKK